MVTSNFDDWVWLGGEWVMTVVADPPLARLPDPVPAMLTTTLRLDRRRQRGQDEQGEEGAPTGVR